MPDTNSSKLSQALSFDHLPADKRVGDEPLTLTATASSKLTVSYVSSNTDVAAIAGDVMTFVGAGTSDVTASQEGNFLYHPASDVVQTIIIGASAINENTVGTAQIFPNPAKGSFFLKRESHTPATLIILNAAGQPVTSKALVSDNESVDISDLLKGVYVLKLDDIVYKIIIE
jgi:hypothetical protein